MTVTSNMKGQLAVSKAELRVVEYGYLPSRPLFDTRYDLIIDNHKSLVRAQVKYANGKPSNCQGAVVVKLDYEDRRKNFYTYREDEVDALIVYIPKVDKLCWLPPKLFMGKRKLNIRLKKPLINQTKGIILAKDYYW